MQDAKGKIKNSTSSQDEAKSRVRQALEFMFGLPGLLFHYFLVVFSASAVFVIKQLWRVKEILLIAAIIVAVVKPEYSGYCYAFIASGAMGTLWFFIVFNTVFNMETRANSGTKDVNCVYGTLIRSRLRAAHNLALDCTPENIRRVKMLDYAAFAGIIFVGYWYKVLFNWLYAGAKYNFVSSRLAAENGGAIAPWSEFQLIAFLVGICVITLSYWHKMRTSAAEGVLKPFYRKSQPSQTIVSRVVVVMYVALVAALGIGSYYFFDMNMQRITASVDNTTVGTPEYVTHFVLFAAIAFITHWFKTFCYLNMEMFRVGYLAYRVNYSSKNNDNYTDNITRVVNVLNQEDYMSVSDHPIAVATRKCGDWLVKIGKYWWLSLALLMFAGVRDVLWTILFSITEDKLIMFIVLHQFFTMLTRAHSGTKQLNHAYREYLGYRKADAEELAAKPTFANIIKVLANDIITFITFCVVTYFFKGVFKGVLPFCKSVVLQYDQSIVFHYINWFSETARYYSVGWLAPDAIPAEVIVVAVGFGGVVFIGYITLLFKNFAYVIMEGYRVSYWSYWSNCRRGKVEKNFIGKNVNKCLKQLLDAPTKQEFKTARSEETQRRKRLREEARQEKKRRTLETKKLTQHEEAVTSAG